jgi:hypothetical protein
MVTHTHINILTSLTPSVNLGVEEPMTLSDAARRKIENLLPGLVHALSNYSFLGGWKRLQQKRGLMSRYSSVVFFFLVLTLGLNILDSLFTMMILDLKGREINPVVQSIMTLYGSDFWIWKFGIVSLSLILLCILSDLKIVKGIIVTLSSVYATVVLYQLFLLTHA